MDENDDRFKEVLSNDDDPIGELEFNLYKLREGINWKCWVPTGVPNWGLYLGNWQNQLYQDDW